MAQNTTQWANVFHVKPEHVAWIERAICDAADYPEDPDVSADKSKWNGEPDSWLAPWRDEYGELAFNAELGYARGHIGGPIKAYTLRLDSNVGDDLEPLDPFLEHLSRHTQESYVVEYASYCSKLRDGEFGGGVIVAVKGRVEWKTTSEMGRMMLAELTKE